MPTAGCEGPFWERLYSRQRNSLLLLLLLLFLKGIKGRCLHEETQRSVSLIGPPVSPLSLEPRFGSGSLSHSNAPSPIRIQAWYSKESNLKSEILYPERDWKYWEFQIDAVLREAIHRIQEVLAVPPVQGSLLLSRDPERYCQAIWRDPDSPNHYKCSLLNPSYVGENCMGVKVTIHELFHILGFSGQLFKKWRDCTADSSIGDKCSPRRQVTRRDEWGQLILTTPTVIHSLARHLGVSETIQGVPLEEEGLFSSHWEARLFQGSVMTATFDGAHRTQIDFITLAAFADSGWYQVNLSAAQELLWGQGSGLNFGLATSCRSGSSEFFCVGSGLGCHYLHFDKGQCSSDSLLEGCRIYKPLTHQSECWKKENAPLPTAENPHGEIYHPKSRCFMANLTSVQVFRNGTTPVPRCYLHRCTKGSTYYVQAAGSPWVLCLPGKSIQVPGYHGLLFCPWVRFCQANKDRMSLRLSTTRPFSLGLLIRLPLGLTGPTSYYLSKMQYQELSQAILRALVIRADTHM
ncbi:ciliated left-right organizer metallopeptidase isoform X2 [Sminthopsis crassicaudata]|uniref:ciliated left-right organizer metallopeptidase isoform X2 n=1 Tax=Sminthopsis crassicaudata TaxID=9301 RepID=UPI003D687EB7